MDNFTTEALHILKDYSKDFKVDYKYTKEKIQIFKNILPYLPEDYIATGGRSIIATEKILKIIEVVEFVNIENQVPVQPLDMESAERAYRIVNTLQEQITNSNIDKLGTVLDIIVNKDKYKQLVNMALEFINNKDALKDTNNISKLLKTFMGEKEGQDNNLSKMLDILTMLEPGEQEEEDDDDEEKEEEKEQPIED